MTDRVYTRNVETVEITSEAHRFGVNDKVGREIGATVYTYKETYETRTDGKDWGYDVQPGTYFSVRPQVTRAGESYGPTQKKKLFNTQDEVDAEIARYFKYARKAAARHGIGVDYEGRSRKEGK